MPEKKSFLSFEKKCPKCKHVLKIDVDRISQSPVYEVRIQGQGNLYNKEEKAKDKAKKDKKPVKKDTPKKGK